MCFKDVCRWGSAPAATATALQPWTTGIHACFDAFSQLVELVDKDTRYMDATGPPRSGARGATQWRGVCPAQGRGRRPWPRIKDQLPIAPMMSPNERNTIKHLQRPCVSLATHAPRRCATTGPGPPARHGRAADRRRTLSRLRCRAPVAAHDVLA